MKYEEIQARFEVAKKMLGGAVEGRQGLDEALTYSFSLFNRAYSMFQMISDRVKDRGYASGPIPERDWTDWQGLMVRSSKALRRLAGELDAAVGASEEGVLSGSGIDPTFFDGALDELIHVAAALSYAKGKIQATIEAPDEEAVG